MEINRPIFLLRNLPNARIELTRKPLHNSPRQVLELKRPGRGRAGLDVEPRLVRVKGIQERGSSFLK